MDRQTAEFFHGAIEQVMQVFALRLMHSFQFRHRSPQPSVGSMRNGCDHLQITADLLDATRCRLGRGLALGFQKQLRLFENALPDLRRCLAPGGV